MAADALRLAVGPLVAESAAQRRSGRVLLRRSTTRRRSCQRRAGRPALGRLQPLQPVQLVQTAPLQTLQAAPVQQPRAERRLYRAVSGAGGAVPGLPLQRRVERGAARRRLRLAL